MDTSINKQVRLNKRYSRHGYINLKRETEFLLITEQNNAIRTDYIKAEIDNMQQKSRWCEDRDQGLSFIICECNKLPRKDYKVMHDWAGKLIHRELYKKLKFDHTKKYDIYTNQDPS